MNPCSGIVIIANIFRFDLMPITRSSPCAYTSFELWHYYTALAQSNNYLRKRSSIIVEPQLMCHYYMQAILLYRDPTGERVFDGTDPTKQAESSEMRGSYYNDRAVGMSELTDAERVTLLTSQVARLKEKMEQIVSRKDQRIAELESIIKS